MNMISKGQPIEDLIQEYPDLVGFLISHNLPCVVCGDPFWGTLEELAKSKGFTDEQIDNLVQEINQSVVGKNR